MSVLTETRPAPRPRHDTDTDTDTGTCTDSAAAAPEHTRPRLVHHVRYTSRRSLGWALTAAGLAMIPWLFVLAASLPPRATAQHWSVAWVGLDSLEAIGLTCTGLLVRRRDPRASLTAAASAVLLLVDAWFDVLTSAPGSDRAIAILMAAGAELPIAALCLTLAVRLFPARRH